MQDDGSSKAELEFGREKLHQSQVALHAVQFKTMVV